MPMYLPDSSGDFSVYVCEAGHRLITEHMDSMAAMVGCDCVEAGCTLESRLAVERRAVLPTGATHEWTANVLAEKE